MKCLLKEYSDEHQHELEGDHGDVSPSTLNSFRNDLKKRAKQREQKQRLQNAPSPSSLTFKSNAAAFSLEHEGTMRPSPYEQALAESLEEFTLSSSSSAEFDGEVYVAATAYSDDVERSFARVTENSRWGLESRPAQARPGLTRRIVLRGNPSTSPPAVAWSSGKGGEKKGAGKKGVSLFSTTQRRSYC